MKKENMKKLVLCALLVMSMLALTACPSSSGSDGKYAQAVNSYEGKGEYDFATDEAGVGYGYYEESPAEDAPQYTSSETKIQDSEGLSEVNYEKLVYEADVRMEAKDFEEAVSALKDAVKENGGAVQNESFRDGSDWQYYSTYGGRYRTYSATLRIPTANYDAFIGSFSGIGHVTSQNSYIKNISQEYYNSKAYLESYQNQLENLQAMYDKAQTIDEMMKIESRISDLNAQIMYLTTNIQSMDFDVAYSTVTVTVSEVVDYTEEPTPVQQSTFFDRLLLTIKYSWSDFLESMEDLLFWLIENLWRIIFAILIITGVVKLAKKKGLGMPHPFKKRRERKAELEEIRKKAQEAAELGEKVLKNKDDN